MCFKILLKYKYTYMYRVYKVLTLVNQLLYNIGLFSATCLSILGKCFKATVSIFSSVHILSSSRTKLQSHDQSHDNNHTHSPVMEEPECLVGPDSDESFN